MEMKTMARIPKAPYRNTRTGEWVFPQRYVEMTTHKYRTKKYILNRIANNTHVQEAIKLDSRTQGLLNDASAVRCTENHNSTACFYGYGCEGFKERVSSIAGWEAMHRQLRTREHYDALYEAVNDLIPIDPFEVYGISERYQLEEIMGKAQWMRENNNRYA